MKKASLLFLGIIIVGWVTGIASADDPFTVGEKWTYKHEGIVPMRPPDFTIVGDRTREVVAVQGENENKRWLIQEKWGDTDEWAGKQFVSAEKLYDKIAAGEDRVLNIEPGYPFDYFSLKPGEEKKLEIKFMWGEERSVPIKLTAKRLNDETAKVPLGEFQNCIHVQSDETISFTGQNGDQININTKRELWYHPRVNGLVKEIYSTTRPDGSENKGTSELKAYSKEKKE